MYNKLFTKILDSSIWLESSATRIVWITFLAMMDQDGFVALSAVGNVANRARVSMEEAAEAIKCLESPDLYNPDQENDGRRIERVPGCGWYVLNAKKHRDLIKAEEVRAQTRERMRKLRERRGDAPVTHGDEKVTPSEAEAEAEVREENLSFGKIKEEPQAAPPSRTATRLPDPFPITPEMWAWLAEHQVVLNDVNAAHEEWVEYWTNNTTAKAKKLRWDLAWQKGMKKAAEWQAERRTNGNGKPTSKTRLQEYSSIFDKYPSEDELRQQRETGGHDLRP